jgi:hypothetical protein
MAIFKSIINNDYIIKSMNLEIFFPPDFLMRIHILHKTDDYTPKEVVIFKR